MAKPKTYEEAQAQVTESKEALKEVRTALREFKSENKVKRGKDPEDAKVKKELEALEAKVEKARAALEAAKEGEKELRPRKERQVKYEYPDGMDDKEKKRYRAKMRREAKQAEKGEDNEGSGEKPAKKTAKKKVVKKATPVEDEDED